MTAPGRARFDEPTLRPYTTSHLGMLTEARRLADGHDRGDMRSLDEWLDHHGVTLECGRLDPACLGLSLIVEGERGVLVSSRIRRRPWRNAVVWHELGHLLTGTSRSVLCRPDDWLSSRLERLAWSAGAIYAVSAFEAVQIGWRVLTVEQVADERDIPVELANLRLALAIRDREIPMLRMDGVRLVEAALRALTDRCRSILD